VPKVVAFVKELVIKQWTKLTIWAMRSRTPDVHQIWDVEIYSHLTHCKHYYANQWFNLRCFKLQHMCLWPLNWYGVPVDFTAG
jgi:hypothetical protein